MAVVTGKRHDAAGKLAVDMVSTELIAVLVAVTAADPRVLTIQNKTALPSGPFKTVHGSLQSGLRDWVEGSDGVYCHARQRNHPDPAAL